LSEFETERKVMEGKFYQEIQRINNHTDIINDKISGVQNSMSQFHRMHDHMADEVTKIKNIFNDSRENFGHLCSKLHEDFTHKVTQLADKTALIDEVRNLYLMQVEAHKEDMKRLDLKSQRAIKDLEN
jgi:predicted nuclease with TOPRIM domain